MRRIRNARTAHASRWTARETSEQLCASLSVCFECYSNTWEQYFFVAFGPVPGCTHITHTQCGIHKFLLYLNLFLATLSFSAQLVALQAAFALACSPSLLVYVFDLEAKKKQSQAKKNKVWQKFSLSTSKKICSSWLIY